MNNWMHSNLNLFGLAKWLAAWGGAGFLPFMPGTWGTIAALLLYIALVYMNANHLSSLGLASVLFAVTLVIFLVGVWSCKFIFLNQDKIQRILPEPMQMKQTNKNHFDPSWIVIDEVAGYGLTVAIIALFKPLTPLLMISAFLIFRVMDIQKPFPIRQIEKYFSQTDQKAPWGVMIDDLIAGLIAALIVVLLIAI